MDGPRPYRIRLASVHDASDISALIESMLHYRSPVPTGPAPPAFTAQFRPEVLASMLASDAYRYHVANEEAQLIGVIGVRDNRHLLHLFVAESHHRRGIAAALWRHAKAAVLETMPDVEMTVRSSIFAVEVYRRFGFTVAGPRVDGPICYVPMCLRLRREEPPA
jgi:GNAT superfamily N-acetyltransferase